MRVRFPRRLTPITLFTIALVALVGFALGRAAPALAGGLVTTCDESSLRAALAGGGSVAFACSGSPVISLASQILITADTTLDGFNGGSTVELAGSARIFSVTQNTALTLTNLILRNGVASYGGCIYANGKLTADNVELRQCQAASGSRGGALYVSSAGSAALAHSSLHNNGGLYGAGIYNLGTLRVLTSSLTSNTGRQGAGIYTDHGATTLVSVTLSANQVNDAGGALYGAQGVLTLTQTVLSNNHAIAGGAIWLDSGSLTLDNAFFQGNTVTNTGGAIHIETGSATLNNSTLQGNSADYGGGIFNKGALVMSSSAISNNNAGTAAGGIRNQGTATLDALAFSGNHAGTTGGGMDNETTLALTNSTFTNNSAGDSGGGLISHGIAVVSNITVTANSAATGAGLHNAGTLTLTNSTLRQNTGTSNGGGFFSNGTATVSSVAVTGNSSGSGAGMNLIGTTTLQGVTVSGNNAAGGGGGGIWSFGTLTISNATINDNSAADGGGLLSFDSSSAANLTDVALNNNKVSTSGGGIYNNGGMTLLRVNVGGNSASVEGGGLWSNGTLTVKSSSLTQNTGLTGGGVNNQGTANLSNSTVGGNLAVNGGGMYNKGPANLVNVTFSNRAVVTGTSDNFFLFDGQLTLANSIVNAEGATHTNCITVLAATHLSQGNNIASDSTCGLTSSGDQQDATILLGPLGLYGGTTLSMLPPIGSVALNNGNNSICAASPINNVDQRGQPRPVNTTCDVGAVERQNGDIDVTPRLYLPAILR